jgi:glycosyltransferase involved in cell wall biosynthesis
MDADVKLIADSGFFDADYYAGTAEAHAMGLSPIAHYLRKGEAEGLAPSVAFDPNFYLDRYPDLRGHIASSLLHFCYHGRQEGRSCRPIADTVVLPTRQILPDRATVIVVVHEATRTGAAILGWNILRALKKNYNVVALLIRGGPIEQAFEDIGDTVMLPADFVWIDAESDALARKMIACYAPRYVIANSVETRHVVPAFEKAGVPTLALIHEFSSNIQPGALHGLIKHAAKIIFSAQIVADSAIADYPDLPARSLVILPQGSSVLPPNNAVVSPSGDAELKDIGVLPADNGTFLVVGIGTITLRKGVEFFIAAAARARRLAPDRNIVFAWVGKCYAFDAPYLAYLREQIQRTGLNSAFMFLGEFEDLAPVYARADLFILSSRLDPLPNVGIDAAVHGVPVICFDQASGIAEILKAAPQTAGLVVPYLDAGAAGDLVVALASDTPRLRAFSDGMRDVAQTHFDMTRYVAALDALGQQALQAKAQMERDHATIKLHDAFNAALYLDASKAAMPTDKALRHYLEASALVAPRDRPRTGMLLRRPLEGFHPLIYAAEHGDFDETSGEDPLAHYARTGRPKGRWHHEVIQPGPSNPPVAAPLRAVIHGHFHYPELLEEFLLRLKANKTPTDLLLTTTSQSRGRQIEQIVAKAKTPNVTVSIVPNQGRDIGVFLSGIEHEMLMRYDLVGHLHGKRSPHAEGAIGESWRHFLWENLLGGEHAMIDVIANAFASDQTLGLVFAEDPHLNDWDRNRPFADDLATRMDLLPLPNHFDFPHGNMFWARPQALKPMFDLGLDWDDYPAEPVPIDGTLLHALERLTPLAAQKAGYRFATTYLPSLTR